MGTTGSPSSPSPGRLRPFPAPTIGLCIAVAIIGFLVGRASVRRPAVQAPAEVAAVAPIAESPSPTERSEPPAERPTARFVVVEPAPAAVQPASALVGEIQRLPSPAPKARQSGKWEPIEGQDWRVLTIDTTVTESNSTWSRFSWKLSLQNLTTQSLSFNATIEFQDRNGFILDTDSAYDLRVLHSQTETFTGFALIKAELVDRVEKAVPRVKFRAVLPGE